jgi:hypothetical protein
MQVLSRKVQVLLTRRFGLAPQAMDSARFDRDRMCRITKAARQGAKQKNALGSGTSEGARGVITPLLNVPPPLKPLLPARTSEQPIPMVS